jgi:WD40 repeat protein
MSQQPLGMQAVLGYGGENIHYGGDDSCMFPSGTTVRKVNYEGGGGGGGAGGGGRGQGGGNTHIPCEGLGVGAMCVHPSLQSFAYCEKGKGAVVRICDMASGAVQHTIEGAADIDVDILTFTSDGSALLTVAGLPDFKVTIWDWMKGVELVQGPAPSKMNTAMFNPVNPDQMLFTTPDDSMFVCNVVAGAQGPEFDFEKFSPPSEELLFTSCTFTEEGVVHCTTSDGCLWVGDPVSGTVVGESVVISAEGAKCHVVATGRHLICWTSTGVVVWLGLETMSEGYRVKVPVRSSDSLISICHGPSSVFVGSKEGNIFQIRLLQDIPDGTYREEEEEPSPVTVKDADALIGEVCAINQTLL